MSPLNRLRAFADSGAFRARPRFLSLSLLLLVSGLSAASFLLAPPLWPAVSDAPPEDPQAQVDSGLVVLRLEGDILSGEATDLVRSLGRTAGEVERSFLDSAPEPGPLMAQLPSGGHVGLVLLRPSFEDTARLDAQVASLLRQFPGVVAAPALPWSHAVVPPVRAWDHVLEVRWLLLALFSSLLLYPLLETFSRAAHLFRAARDGVSLVAGMASGALLAISVSGVLAAAGVGHGPSLLPSVLAAGMFGALLPILWERQHSASGEEVPHLAASAPALMLSALLALPMTVVGLLLAWVPGSPAFGAQFLQVAAAGISLLTATATTTALRLLLRRPSAPSDRAVSVLSEVLLTASSPLAKVLRRRVLAASLLLLLAAAVTVGPAAAGLLPQPSSQVPPQTPSLLLEVSSREGQVSAPAAARFLEEANEQPWLSSGRELFGAPAISGGLVFSFDADPSLSPAGLERALGSIPLDDGLLVRAVGGSYRAWGEWTSALPLASFSAALLASFSAAAAATVFAHVRFRFARAGLLLLAPLLAAGLVHAPSLLAGDAPSPMFTLTFLACSLWALLFAVEFSRDCDSGSDGSSAAREAWVSSAPLALLAVPLSLAVPGLAAAALASALLGTLLLALAFALLLGPRDSLRL